MYSNVDINDFMPLFTIMIALFSLAISLMALFLSIQKTMIAAKSLEHQAKSIEKSGELQALIQFRNLAKQLNYSEGIDIISNLYHNNYSDFKADVSEEAQEKIRGCVEFLNFAANLVAAGHIKEQSVWNIYFMAYRIIGNKLDPWWFAAMSEGHPNRYSECQKMARKVLKISDNKIREFDRKRDA